ncbi:uncharacterized protein O3C94_006739 [Discoglossus pictus]
MEEAMIHTGDSYGMDGRAKLPNFTEHVDWKGLEDLYSVNESLYGYRNNYRLSLDDWANYLKDVDRVFALLNSYSKEIRTNKTGVASPAQTTLVEMPSAESEEDFSGRTADEKGPTMEVNLGILNLSTEMSSHEQKLETKNEFPEEKQLNQAHWSKRQTDRWTKHIDLDTYEAAFSGNGMTELESKQNLNLQTVSDLPTEAQEHSSHMGEDIFEEQVYLPFEPESFVQQVKNISISEDSSNCENPESKQDHSEEMCKNINIEGSASLPHSSD